MRDAWATLERTAFRRTSRGIAVRETLGSRRPATLWTLVHVLWGACDAHDLGHTVPLTELTELIDGYRRGSAYAATPRGKVFFDDDAWLGLVSLRLASATGSDAHLARARELIRVVRTGEDPEGGVRWAEHATTRNTCSTASASWLALLAGGPDDRVFAERTMRWLTETLGLPDGLVADGIDRGVVEPTVWSYNQGAAVAALRLLGREEEAERTAAASLETFRGSRRWREPPPFLAIWYRALVGDPSVGPVAIASLRDHVDRLTRVAYDETTGLFNRGSVGSYDGRTTIDLAATIQLLALRELTS